MQYWPANDSLWRAATSEWMFYFVNILSWYQIYSVIACCAGQSWGLRAGQTFQQSCREMLAEQSMSALPVSSDTSKLFPNVYPGKLLLDKSYFIPTSHITKQRRDISSRNHTASTLWLGLLSLSERFRQHLLTLTYTSKLIILIHNYCSTVKTLAGNTIIKIILVQIWCMCSELCSGRREWVTD